MHRPVLLCLSIFVSVGCSTVPQPPDLGKLYSRSAQYHGPERNPVIVIPGIMGSRLVDEATGKVVWGAFGGDFANPSKQDGALLCALPLDREKSLSDLMDEVYVDGALDRFKVRLLFVPLELNAYLNILGTLGVGGYVDADLPYEKVDYGDQHFTCFQFAYDWRRSNIDNARLLHEFVQEKRAFVQQQLKEKFGVEDYDVNFDIVAHSMGGLITRYFLRYGNAGLPEDGSAPDVTWAGAEHIERVICVGTPSAGSLFALEKLVYGLETGPTLPFYPPTVVGTYPSIFELLPRVRHGALVNEDAPGALVDFLDPRLWRMMEWGLADPDADTVRQWIMPGIVSREERWQTALDRLEKSLVQAKRFHAALDVPARPPDGTELFLIAGDSVPTPSVFAVNLVDGDLTTHAEAAGDGTVIRQSALMDERMGGAWQPMLVSPVAWERVSFMFNSHIGMTMDPNFADNVLYMLLEDPRP